ncbi:NADPH2:quinone reductase [Pseudomonas sp. SJZ079]|uniref:zinc-dependent alcohol dehydrogenase family protein n=1 Tax=Pseudomonas sp. SJZ079 TaxID=2572887 RepID=UPI001199DC92|nr:zinc-dependent alcohol dehydrogenase family protein [Pseudomonas sp. SJZ079]TWC41624.1 NADPH2:quinone reductase [Pseudomonas sp. SJZ079]
MKAMVIKRFGPADVFEEMELPTPQVGARQVLVKVEATAVNPLDFKLRRGDLPGFTHDFPAVLHSDFAGTLVEVGPGVSDFKVGDRVFGCAGGVRGRQGALAEYMLADAALIARQPSRISAAEAATLPLVAITAWEGLIDRVEIRPGQRVLVHAGTGGVGHVAAQLAKWRGAQVFTTVSSAKKAELSRLYGADVTINYREQSVTDYVQSCTQGEGFDVVVDTVGGDVLQNSLEATKVGGHVITTLAMGNLDITQAWARKLSLHCVNMSWPMASGVGMEHHGFILREVARLVDEGLLSPLLDPQRFSFAEVSLAHTHAEAGAALGKVSISRA